MLEFVSMTRIVQAFSAFFILAFTGFVFAHDSGNVDEHVPFRGIVLNAFCYETDGVLYSDKADLIEEVRKNAQPLSGAKLFYYPEDETNSKPLETVADEQGCFEFNFSERERKTGQIVAVSPDEGVIDGFYLENIDNPGAEFHEGRYVFRMDRKGMSVYGTVIDSQDKPVENAIVFSNGFPYGIYTFTNADGEFILYQSIRYPTVVCALKHGKGFGQIIDGDWLSRHKNSTTFDRPLSIQMSDAKPFQLQVVDPQGNSVADSKIRFYVKDDMASEDIFPGWFMTDEQGTLDVDWLPKEMDSQILIDIDPKKVSIPLENGNETHFARWDREPVKRDKNSKMICVMQYLGWTLVRIRNPFTDDPAVQVPRITFRLPKMIYSPNFRTTDDPEVIEYLFSAAPGTEFYIHGNLQSSPGVLPTIFNGKMGSELEDGKLSLTIQKGTPIRLRMFDDLGNRLMWGENAGFHLREIEPGKFTETGEPKYGLHHSVFEVLPRGEKGDVVTTDEILFYLPRGEYEIKPSFMPSVAWKNRPYRPYTKLKLKHPAHRFKVDDDKEIRIDFNIIREGEEQD